MILFVFEGGKAEPLVFDSLKRLLLTFAYPGAKQYRFIDLTKTSVEDVRRNWHFLIQQNVSKANFIVCDRNEMPVMKDVINQIAIFEGQKSKYVDVDETVAILNSFPLFVYEYLK